MPDESIPVAPVGGGTPVDSAGLSRRQVLVRGALTTTAIALGGTLLNACSKRTEDHPQVTSGTVSVGTWQEVPAGTVSTRFMIQYGIVLSNDSGTVLAIRPKCTHKGCIVPWVEEQNQFVCPCHGSRYNILGQVVHGPAKRPLPAITTVKKSDGTLTVDLDALYQRAG